jgi:hypothetical protein
MMDCRVKPGNDEPRFRGHDEFYQLRLKPALKLRFGAPCGVSPIEPETLTQTIRRNDEVAAAVSRGAARPFLPPRLQQDGTLGPSPPPSLSLPVTG